MTLRPSGFAAETRIVAECSSHLTLLQNRDPVVHFGLQHVVEAVEGATQGKAFDAQIEDDSFSPEFEVSVVADGKIYDVIVNAKD